MAESQDPGHSALTGYTRRCRHRSALGPGFDSPRLHISRPSDFSEGLVISSLTRFAVGCRNAKSCPVSDFVSDLRPQMSDPGDIIVWTSTLRLRRGTCDG